MPLLDRLRSRALRLLTRRRRVTPLADGEVESALERLDDATTRAEVEALALAVARRGDLAALERLFAHRRVDSLGLPAADWLARHCLDAMLSPAADADEKLARLAGLGFLPLADTGRPARLFRQIFRDRARQLEPAAAARWAAGLPATLGFDLTWPIFKLGILERRGASCGDDDLAVALAAARAAADGGPSLTRQEAEFLAIAVAGQGEPGELAEALAQPALRGLPAERADWLARQCLKRIAAGDDRPGASLERVAALGALPLADPTPLVERYRGDFQAHLATLAPAEVGEWVSGLPARLAFDPEWPRFARAALDAVGVAMPERRDPHPGHGVMGRPTLAARLRSLFRTVRAHLPGRLSLREAEALALAVASRGDPGALRRVFARPWVQKLDPERLDWLARHALHRSLVTAADADEKLARLAELDFLPLADAGRLARTWQVTFRDHVQTLDPDEAAKWAFALPATLAFDATWPIFRLATLDSQGVASTDKDFEAAVAEVGRRDDLTLAEVTQVCGLLYSRRALDQLERWKERALALASEPSLDLARMHLAVAERAAALEVVDGVLAERPDDTEARLFKARLLQTMNRTESALEIYRELLAGDPDLVAAQAGTLSAYRAMGRPEADLLGKIDEWADHEADPEARHRTRMARLLAGRLPHRAFLEAWEHGRGRAWSADTARELGHSLAALGEMALAEWVLRDVRRTGVLDSRAEQALRHAERLRDLLGGEPMRDDEATAACEALADRLAGGARYEEIADEAAARRRLRVPEALMFLARRLAPPIYPAGGPICLVTSTLGPGGAERQLVYTACGLRERLGEEAELYVLCGRQDERLNNAFFLDSLDRAGIPVVRPTSRSSTGAAAPEARREISRLLGLWPREAGREQLAGYYRFFVEHRPGIVHAWQDETMVLAGFAALLAGVPWVVLSGQSLKPSRRPHRSTYLEAGLRVLCEYPQVHLTVNSAAGARDYADWLDYPLERITVLHNGLALSEIDEHLESRSVDALRDELGIPRDAPVVGAVMRMTEEKRPNLCLDILLELLEAAPDCHALMIGDGPMWQEVSARGLASPVGDRLRFPGVISPVEPWMAAMDLLILTSAIEGLPNVLLEAQYSRTPVAATDAGGAREAWVEGETGFLFPSEEPVEMAGMLAGLLAERPALAAAGERAREHVAREFSAAKMIDTTLTAFGLDGDRDDPARPDGAGAGTNENGAGSMGPEPPRPITDGRSAT